MSHSTSLCLLVASEAKVPHAIRALGVAEAASKCIEALTAFGEPHEAPLFAVFTVSEGPPSSTITLGLVAESQVVWIALWTVLITKRTDSGEAFLTLRVAKPKDLILSWSAGGKS